MINHDVTTDEAIFSVDESLPVSLTEILIANSIANQTGPLSLWEVSQIVNLQPDESCLNGMVKRIK
jgi:hypothetical protein